MEEWCSVARGRYERRLSTGCVMLTGIAVGATLALAQEPVPNPTPASPAPRAAVISPKAQDILDRTIQALGGTAFLGFKRLSTKGRAFAFADGETAGLEPYESWVEFPDKRRFSYGKKEPVILVNNGDHGWELDPYGPTAQKRSQVIGWKLTVRYGLENLLRLRIHEPGMLIQDSGTDFIDNLSVRVLTLIDSSEVETKLCVNKVNYLPVRIQYRVRNPQNDDWDVYADVYSDYLPMQGIKTPMHITRFLNDERIGETFRNTAKYDENYPPSYFQAPY